MYLFNYKGIVEYLINDLGLIFVKEDNDYIRLDIGCIFGRYVDVYKYKIGCLSMGVGLVYYIVFGVEVFEIEIWKINLEVKGFIIIGVKDRKFFKLLYYRELGGVIIEFVIFILGFEMDSEYKEVLDFYMLLYYMYLKDEVEVKFMLFFIRNIDSFYEYFY